MTPPDGTVVVLCATVTYCVLAVCAAWTLGVFFAHERRRLPPE